MAEQRRLPSRAVARASTATSSTRRSGSGWGRLAPWCRRQHHRTTRVQSTGQHWATLDVKKANELLDRIGLTKKDAEGYRLRTDGKGRLRIEIMTLGGQFLQFTQIAEMIREQWKKIGIQADVRKSSVAWRLPASAANEHAERLAERRHRAFFHLPGPPLSLRNQPGWHDMGPLWAQWFRSNGTQGKEPLSPMQKLMEMWKKAFGVPEKERIKIGKEIWRIAVGGSGLIGAVGCRPAAKGYAS